MESLTTIDNLSIMLLIVIDLGCVFRIVFCAIMMNSNENEQMMKKRIKNILIFLAVANSIFSLVTIAQSYWG